MRNRERFFSHAVSPNWHDIRHTYVTLTRDHGVDSKFLTDRGSHASENVTKLIEDALTHAG